MGKCDSIYDLARIAGVSYATVSRVLNHRGNVSEASRRSVLEAARRCNFKPRMQARRRTIGIYVNLMRSHSGYRDTLLLYLMRDLGDRGAAVEIFSRNRRHELSATHLDAVIAVDDALSDRAAELSNIPVCVINAPAEGHCSGFVSDHAGSGRLAAEYLFRRGLRRPAIVLDSRNWGNSARLEGWLAAWRESGVAELPVGVAAEQSESVLFRQLLSTRPDSIFLAGEDNILACLNVLETLAARPGGVREIVTMENPLVSRYLLPPLTTVAQPLEEMLGCAVDQIFRQLAGGAAEPVRRVFPNQLIER